MHSTPGGKRQQERQRPLRVLVTDDDPSLLEAARRMLQWLGASVCLARCAEEALGMLSEPDGEVDAILMDYHMPGMNGLEALDTMQQLGLRCPVILSTAQLGPEFARSPGGALPAAILPKPYTLMELRCALEKVTDRACASASVYPVAQAENRPA